MTDEQYEEENRRAARILGEILGPRWRVQSAGDYVKEVRAPREQCIMLGCKRVGRPADGGYCKGCAEALRNLGFEVKA